MKRDRVLPKKTKPEDGKERLQKLLANRGLASRREAETWIEAGRVRVNGAVVRELGVKVDPSSDEIEVDGVAIPGEVRRVAVLLNKPVGYTTTVRDPHAEHTVMELLQGLRERVYPVGRLDKDSRGVLLLTNDGDLAQALLHPKGEVDKVYRVTVAGELAQEEIDRLEAGVEIEDGLTAPAKVSQVLREKGRTRFRLTLREGMKRQVRRMVRAVGGRVMDLERVSFAGLTARELAEGSWRILTQREVESLRRIASGRSRPSRAPRHSALPASGKTVPAERRPKRPGEKKPMERKREGWKKGTKRP